MAVVVRHWGSGCRLLWSRSQPRAIHWLHRTIGCQRLEAHLRPELLQVGMEIRIRAEGCYHYSGHSFGQLSYDHLLFVHLVYILSIQPPLVYIHVYIIYILCMYPSSIWGFIGVFIHKSVHPSIDTSIQHMFIQISIRQSIHQSFIHFSLIDSVKRSCCLIVDLTRQTLASTYHWNKVQQPLLIIVISNRIRFQILRDMQIALYKCLTLAFLYSMPLLAL